MMKPYVYLVIIKQWKHYLALIGILLCMSFIIWGVQQNLNKTLRIPVAVQDMSNSAQSTELVNKLRQHDIIQLEKYRKTMVILMNAYPKRSRRQYENTKGLCDQTYS